MSSTWTENELGILRSNYQLSTKDLMKLLPNRTPHAITGKAYKLGLTHHNVPKLLQHEVKKSLSQKHRNNLSTAIKNWWRLNREENAKFIELRNRRISEILKGRSREDLRHPTGRSPANKGSRTGKIKNCEQCQKEFYVAPSAKARRFCSQKCMGTYLSNGGWHISHPNVNWYRTQLVKSTGKCEICGFSDKRILQIHHKDGNRKNKRRENLIVLCPNCHMLQHIVNGRLKLGRALRE